VSVPTQSLERARRIAEAIAGLPGVVAASLGGSAAAGLADASSDLDLHVYWRGELAGAGERAASIGKVADEGSVVPDVRFWGLEDHFHIDGQLAELVYVNLDDLQADVARAYGEGIGGEGFVTAQLFYVTNSALVLDPTGEVGALRARLLAGYPEPTRRLVVRDNPFLMRYYLNHVRQAQGRGDLLFVQHRRYAVQMVFFNLLFALNRRYHPGEKRLLIHGAACDVAPRDLAIRWAENARLAADDAALPESLGALVEDLCQLAEVAYE
jgi:hypothetical protein